jgi:hypothetical protein
MSFFPEKTMPLSPKKNSQGSGSISADDYNAHDEEIVAIEQFLSQGELGSEGAAYVSASIEKLNSFSKEGVQTSSGYVVESSPFRIIVPEQVVATFLGGTLAPSATSDVIQVISTTGFPASGIISIVSADSDTTETVEWVRYTGKSPTQFSGCTRGTFGTGQSLHPLGTASQTNTRTVKKGDVLQRWYPGYRRLSVYDYVPLSWHGTKSQILAALVSCPQDVDLNSAAAAPALSMARGVAGDGGRPIVITGATGLSALRSDLSYSEAEDFFDTLGLVPVSPDQVQISSVPVFMGQLSLQDLVVASTGDYAATTTTALTGYSYNGSTWVQLFTTTTTPLPNTLGCNSPVRPDLSGLGGCVNAAKSYQTFCAASLRTKLEGGA